MNNDESILVLSAFILATVLYIMIVVKGPRLGILNKNAYFDKSRLRTYYKFLASVLLLSIVFGYLVTRKSSLVWGYVGLNLFISGVMGANLILYRQRKG